MLKRILGFIQPICLPTDYLLVHDFVSEDTIVAGWGYTDSDLAKLAEDLQFVKVPIRDRCACKDIYKYRSIDESQLCAGLSTGEDSCNGDSGGPLMKQIPWKGIRRTFVLGIHTFA